MFVAAVGGIIYIVYCSSFSPFSIPMMMGYGVMAVLGSIAPQWSVAYVGILINLVHNAFVFSVYHFAFGYTFGKNLLYSATNITFNAKKRKKDYE